MLNGLRAARDDVAALKTDLSYDSRQERGAPLSRLDQGHSQLGSHNLDGNPWESGARPEIGDRLDRRREDSQELKAIQQNVFYEPLGFDRAYEPMDALPTYDQSQVLTERIHLVSGEAPLENLS
jgi:hypothetical protein